MKPFSLPKISARDPLLYVSILLFSFWMTDFIYKLVIQEAPTRILWWSSSGLLLTAIGLLFKNNLLISGMFCALLVTEGLWTVSFILNFFQFQDPILIAQYAFGTYFPTLGYLITLFHLFILPALFMGLFRVKKVHTYGWVAAFLFALVISYSAMLFPDPKEDVNCTKMTLEACRIFLGIFSNFNPYLRIVLAATSLACIVFVPINLLLVLLARIRRWKIEP
jgi:hypothetical protein